MGLFDHVNQSLLLTIKKPNNWGIISFDAHMHGIILCTYDTYYKKFVKNSTDLLVS